MADCAERLIRSRHSTRAFLPDSVDQATIEKIFELARLAPSGSNGQPWIVHVVSGALRDRMVAELVAAFDAGNNGADWPIAHIDPGGTYGKRRHTHGARLYGALGIAREDAESRTSLVRRNLELYGAPHVSLLFMPSFADVRTSQDVGMYAQTLMLAMAGYNVDSCAMGLLGQHASTIKRVLGLPSSLKLLFGVSFGYSDPDAPVNKIEMARAPLAETTTFRS